MSDILEEIEWIRRKRNKSMDKTARELGVTMQTYWRWITHRNNPSPLCVMQIEIYIKKYMA